MVPKMGPPGPPKQSKAEKVYAWAREKGINIDYLHHTAAEVKMLYLSFRRGLFPSLAKAHEDAEDMDDMSDINDAWHKTAMAIVDANAKTSTWVTAQLIMSSNPYSVFPSNLYDKNAQARYIAFTTTEADRIRILLASQAAKFLTELDIGRSAREILEAQAANQLDDVFVYCAAKAYKLDDLVAKKEQVAKFILTQSPYKEIYGEHFKGILDGDSNCTS